MKHFLVVNLGGSGSMFLADMLNKSKQWTVKHETLQIPSNVETPHPEDIEEVQNIFTDYRGEVNGFLRFHLNYIKVDKKAIILRNLNDIYLSWFGHYRGFTMDSRLFYEQIDRLHYQTYRSLLLFDQYIRGGMMTIDFKKMTTSPNYLISVAEQLGITDLKISKNDMKKTNSHKKKGYKYNDIPFYYRDMWERLTAWFNEKYIL